MNVEWQGLQGLKSKSYICGYCNNSLVSNSGYRGNYAGISASAYLYICHFCTQPTFFDIHERQTPGASFGNTVSGVSANEVKSIYDEARDCMKVNAFTAAVLCCRKLLMNLAVAKGAKKGLSFSEYVKFFADEGIIGKDSKGWVDHIRDKGNDATHEIPHMSKEDAENLITFSEMLLKTIYEFPSKIKSKTP